MLSEIINETKTIMLEVDGIGQVNAWKRAVVMDGQVLSAYKDEASGQIRGWDITRESTSAADRNVGSVDERHTIVIRGFMSIQDAEGSEQTFQDLVEDVRAALRTNRTLNGKVLDSTPPQARTVTAATIGGILCHYAEIAFQPEEFPLATS